MHSVLILFQSAQWNRQTNSFHRKQDTITGTSVHAALVLFRSGADGRRMVALLGGKEEAGQDSRRATGLVPAGEVRRGPGLVTAAWPYSSRV
jgi:hypothetical protein